MSRVPALLATALVLVVSGGACRKQPPAKTVAGTQVAGRVSLRPAETGSSDNTNWASRIYPARMSRPILPAFPAEALESRVPLATVRVEFVIDVAGHARDVRATATDAVPHAAAFEAACLAVAEAWRFSPAWRLSREGDEAGTPVVPVEFGAYLEFQFDLAVHDAGGAVEVLFGGG